jgi:hypothetical protein
MPTENALPHPMQENNRKYFAKMRHRYFTAANAQFQEIYRRAFHPLEKAGDLARFHSFIETLGSAFDYSQLAIRGLSRNKLATYSKDPEGGVLAEEVLLVHFLEEVLSSAIFLHNRIKTTRNIMQYQNLLHISSKTGKTTGSGYLGTLVKIIKSNQKNEAVEFQQIMRIILVRLKVIGQVLVIIKKIHHR